MTSAAPGGITSRGKLRIIPCVTSLTLIIPPSVNGIEAIETPGCNSHGALVCAIGAATGLATV